MKGIMEGLFNYHDKQLKNLEKRVQNILNFEEEFSKLSDEELKSKTLEFKKRLNDGQSLDDILEEAFAVVREASFRVLGMKHYPVQIMGGIVLHEGNIAQMQTGEGKTLVATLPSYLNALTEEGVFIITVNEYLANRDKEEMGKIHQFLGLSVGYISRTLGPIEKKNAYNCDITYGTNSEYGFDYLRDNMALTKSMQVQRKLNYAIIDEVDSILIDEARTPLIMSGDSKTPSQYYITVDKFVKSLDEKDYEKDNKTNSIHLSQNGMDKAEKIFALKNIAEVKNTELLHHIRQSLHANYGMEKDKDYVVKDDEIIIIDKFTGRLMPGRTFGNGLHQAIEAKEGVEIQKESKTMAMITYQNFFKLFNKISGMTGTAYTEKQEFKDIYGMDVISIPTNNPIKRTDKTDLLFKTKEAKFKSMLEDIEKRHKEGQPILLGTIYIDESEKISELLKSKNIKHNLLNAKQNKDEAEIIAQAGQKYAVTIATNMAGRGTDIKLGEGVDQVGGLYVIGTERHESRRIDNQLRGRSGRQGDPGESQFFISLEDSLFEKIDKDVLENIKNIVEKLGLKENEHIQDKLVAKSVDGVQKDIEAMNYRIRKSTLEFDQILNKQRETIYNERSKILNGEDMSSFIKEIIKDVIYTVIDGCTGDSPYAEEWNLSKIEEYLDKELAFNGRINFKELDKSKIESLSKQDLKDMILEEAYSVYSEKEKSYDSTHIRYLERLTLMRAIDEKWVDHLDLVEQLRESTYFQHVGGNNSIRLFNEEAFEMFENMLYEIKTLTIKSLFTFINVNQEIKEIQVKEEEKQNKILELEDKYKINRRYIPTVPANTETIKFNVDINATEKVKVDIALYYMDNGYEQRLKDFDKTIEVEGIFPVEFKKEELWNMGWYQLKAFVGGIEARHIDFLVIAPQGIEHEEMLIDKDTILFSNKREVIKFNLDIEDYDEEQITAYLVYNGNEQEASPFNLKVRGGLAGVSLRKPEQGWQNGFYELVFYVNEKRNSIPFVVLDEFSKTEEDITIKFIFNNEQNKEVDLICQIVNIDENKIAANVPIKTNETGQLSITLKNDKKIFKEGRYEFRLVQDTKIILIQYFLIS